MRLLRLTGGRQLLPTTAWAIAGGPNLYDVNFTIERPSSPSVLVTDIKDWLVTNPDDEKLRQLNRITVIRGH
jgi:hypothetical protein